MGKIKIQNSNIMYIAIAEMIFSFVVIFILHPESIFSVVFFLICTMIINKVMVHEDIGNLIFYFFTYMFWCMLICLIQYVQYPHALGMTTGNAFAGGGTDDTYFFGAAALDIYDYFPYRRGKICVDFWDLDGYSKILRLFASFFHIFYKNHPIDLLLFNVSVMSFLPVYVLRIGRRYIYNEKIIKWLATFVLICPTINSNGVVLLRDGIIAVLFTQLAFYMVTNQPYRKMIFPILLIGFLRFGTCLIIIVAICCVALIKKENISKRKMVSWFAIILILCLVLFIYRGSIYSYIYMKFGGNDSLYRLSLSERMVSNNSKDSFFTMASKYPLWARNIINVLLIFVAPRFSLETIFIEDIFVVRHFMTTTIYPIFFCFTVPYFFAGYIYLIRTKEKTISIMYFVSLVLIAIISLQLRHKTMIMPLFYLISAIGKENTKKNKSVFLVSSSVLFLLEVLYFIF